MKTRLLLLILAFICVSNIQAQKVYTSTQLKLIFSTAPNIERAGNKVPSPMRFTCFFNYSVIANIDLTKHLGLSIGGEIKNIGLIMNKDSAFHVKSRAYALGIPIYIRLGNMDKRWYFFGGAQYDYLFAYKEKVFYDDSKTKRTNDYSGAVNPFIPSVFIGYREKNGASFSINYMLQNFYSDEYRFKDPTQGDKPYTDGYKNSQILYFSIGFMGDLDKPFETTKPKPKVTNAMYYHRNH